MQRASLPTTVLHNIFANCLRAHDQLIFSKMFRRHLVINNQTLATILRLALPSDLHHLSDPIVRDNHRYIVGNNRVTERHSSLSWPITLERAFDVETFNRTWGHFSTELFALYSRLFSYSPFFYRPQYPLVDVFNVLCKFTEISPRTNFFIEHQQLNKKLIQLSIASFALYRYLPSS